MRKVIFVIGVILAVLAIAFVANLKYTKSFSPEDVAKYNKNGLSIKVYYCQPSKKDREIFGSAAGALVPFGKVWRTGANEATEIEFNQALTIQGKELEAGRYSIFTIPEEDHWTVIFNKDLGQWGAFDYNPELDVLRVEVPSQKEEVFNEVL